MSSGKWRPFCIGLNVLWEMVVICYTLWFTLNIYRCIATYLTICILMESNISIYFIMNQQQVKCQLLVIRTYILWPNFDSIVEMLQHIRLRSGLKNYLHIWQPDYFVRGDIFIQFFLWNIFSPQISKTEITYITISHSTIRRNRHTKSLILIPCPIYLTFLYRVALQNYNCISHLSTVCLGYFTKHLNIL